MNHSYLNKTDRGKDKYQYQNFFSPGNPYPCPNRELACENKGYCEVRKGAPYCVCQDGYSGEKCHLVDTGVANVVSNTTGH